MEKTLDEILKEIKAGLTGEVQTDLKYLDQKCREYKDHERGREIVGACGQIMVEILPEEQRAELLKAMEEEQKAERAVIDEIKLAIDQQEYEKALSLLDEVEKRIAGNDFYEGDEANAYFQFDEFMQEILYRFYEKPTKAIREAKGVPYCEIYGIYGDLLIKLERVEKAREMLTKGLRWNPLSFTLTMAYEETFKKEENLDKAWELTVQAFKLALHPAQLGRCYRELGSIFGEKKLYTEAVACFLASAQFGEKEEEIQAELNRIKQLAGKTLDPSMQDFTDYAKQYGFPIGADENVVGLAYNCGRHFLEEKQYEGARYCLNIAYELTGDAGIKELLSSIPGFSIGDI